METLARYAQQTRRDVFALVRANSDAEAQERLDATLALVGVPAGDCDGRVTAVAADIEREGLGLEPERRADLAGRVSEIVHSAASVSFSLPLEDSRRINVGGTRQMLDFAESAREHGGLERFAYVSTAYVAGTHAGEFREDQLDVGQDFRNAYEQSKFEAEQLVRQQTARLPIQVFRPSIIVGERESGWTAAFNVLYSPLKAFVRGALPFLPADRRAPVDVVPVDYVADAIFTLTRTPVADSGETFHLVSGPRATTVGGLSQRAAAYLERKPPRIVPPRLYRRLLHPLLTRTGSDRRRRGLARAEVFFPYFTMRVRFDDRRARQRLVPHGIEAPPVEQYLDKLMDFARRADWAGSACRARRPLGPGPASRSSSRTRRGHSGAPRRRAR
jgi:long-chain acyl-CoA synthetase